MRRPRYTLARRGVWRLHRPLVVSPLGDLGGPSLVFRARHHLCALPLGHVVETMRPLATEPLGAAPPYVLGLAVVRGGAVPVVEVARLLRLGAAPRDAERPGRDEPATGARFVGVRAGSRGGCARLAVDAVVGIRTIAAAALEALPPLMAEADDGAIGSIGRLDGELLLNLRAARLLPDEAAVVLGGAP